MSDLEPLAHSVRDVVRLTGMSRATVYRAIEDGSLPSVRTVGRRLILRSDLLEYLRSHRVTRQTEAA